MAGFFDKFTEAALTTYKTLEQEKRYREEQKWRREEQAEKRRERELKDQFRQRASDMFSGNMQVPTAPASTVFNPSAMPPLDPNISIGEVGIPTRQVQVPPGRGLPMRFADNGMGFNETGPLPSMSEQLGQTRRVQPNSYEGIRALALDPATMAYDPQMAIQMASAANQMEQQHYQMASQRFGQAVLDAGRAFAGGDSDGAVQSLLKAYNGGAVPDGVDATIVTRDDGSLLLKFVDEKTGKVRHAVPYNSFSDLLEQAQSLSSPDALATHIKTARDMRFKQDELQLKKDELAIKGRTADSEINRNNAYAASAMANAEVNRAAKQGMTEERAEKRKAQERLNSIADQIRTAQDPATKESLMVDYAILSGRMDPKTDFTVAGDTVLKTRHDGTSSILVPELNGFVSEGQNPAQLVGALQSPFVVTGEVVLARDHQDRWGYTVSTTGKTYSSLAEAEDAAKAARKGMKASKSDAPPNAPPPLPMSPDLVRAAEKRLQGGQRPATGIPAGQFDYFPAGR